MTHRWRILCATEGRFVETGFQRTAPTGCPNDSIHVVGGCELIDSKSIPNFKTVVFRGTNASSLVFDSLEAGVFTEVSTIPFEGTGLLGVPESIKVIGRSIGGTGGIIRLISIDTGSEIASAILPTTDNTVVELTVNSDWPTGETLLSLQVTQSGGATITLKNLTLTL